MNEPTNEIRVSVDVTNPGQFFACCGLLELANRLWPGTEAWFKDREFRIEGRGSLHELVTRISHAQLQQLDPDDETSTPIELNGMGSTLRLDWWKDELAGGKELKVWAGRMDCHRIARAMQRAIRNDDRFKTQDLLNVGLITYDPDQPEKKVEPYYFDARRGPNAHSRDVGFSPNDLELTTTAFPAVEFLCLVGLQRCLPARTTKRRVFDYFTWDFPVAPSLLPAVVAGVVRTDGSRGYRFENWYRTGQKKHKAFRSATPLSDGEQE